MQYPCPNFGAMKTKAEVQQDIGRITMEIHGRYPELIKFISETPVKTPINEQQDISVEDLENYYLSLKNIIRRYSCTHLGQTKSE